MKLGLIFNNKNTKDDDLKAKNEILEDSIKIYYILKKYNVKFLVTELFINYENFIICDNYKDLIKNSDIVVVFGGDGTIIKFAKLCAEYNKAIIGINKGNLGFLANLEMNEIHKMENIFTNNFKVKKNIILECSVGDNKFLALNDIILTRDTQSRIVEYQIYKKDENNICRYNADGVIVSTSAGSTAYFLSAGGPIIDPELNCLAIAPICPHTLCSRNYVLETNKPINIKYILKKNSKICIFIDGNLSFSGLESSEIIIKRSKLEAKFIVFPDYDFYKKLNKKLIEGAIQ